MKRYLEGYVQTQRKSIFSMVLILIRYVVGIFFLLGGIAELLQGSNGILSPMFALFLGIILTPIIGNPTEKKLNISLSNSMKFVIVLFLFVGFVAFSQPAEPTVNDVSDPIASDTQQVNNSTIESTVNEAEQGNNNTVDSVPQSVKEVSQETVKVVNQSVKENSPKPVEAVNESLKESSLESVKTETKSSTNYQDVQWIAASTRYSQIIGNDLSNVGEASRNSDFESMSNYGSTLYYDSEAAIEECNKYEVSSSLKPAKYEFEKALYYSRDAGSNIVSAVYELNQGRTDEAKNYLTLAADDMNKCHEHTENAARLLDEYKSNL